MAVLAGADAANSSGPQEDASSKLATAANDAAEAAAITRPLVALPMAALATLIAATFDLYFLHAIAEPGSIPDTKAAFVIDAFLTGLLVSGGAKPFHDLVDRIAPKPQPPVPQ